jgi:hypothetical protein
MKRIRESLPALLVGAVLLSALAACQKKEGPLEQAGKQVDQAVEKAGDEIQDATRRDKK